MLPVGCESGGYGPLRVADSFLDAKCNYLLHLSQLKGLSLPRFPGHLNCGEILAQRGVQDGYTIPGGVPRAGGGVSAAA